LTYLINSILSVTTDYGIFRKFSCHCLLQLHRLCVFYSSSSTAETF